MRKSHASTMTSDEFVYRVSLLGGNYSKVAEGLGRAPATISMYASGLKRIPNEVVERLQQLIEERKAQIQQISWLGFTGKQITDADILDANHRIRMERAQHASDLPHLAHRHRKTDTSTYPIYRMSGEKMRVYLEALNHWAKIIRAAHAKAETERQRQGYVLELADLKALAEFAREKIKQGAPYDVCIQKSEWLVVSRALRRYFMATQTDAALALYQHWRSYKNVGYPI